MRLAARDRKSTLPDYLIKEPPPLPIALDLVRLSAKLLFANGQTTQKIVLALGQMAGTLGFKLTIYPNWGEVIVRLEDNTRSCSESIAIEPAGVDLSKVSATMGVIFQICEGRIDAAAARMALAEISRAAPVSLVRFALLAAAGAAALGVIFGANYPVTLALIALVAGVGACLRRWLAGLSHNLFVQPFGAALLAGIAGAIAVHLQLSSPLRLVALCPCMILVPGPHILTGAMDVARARIPLGIARLTYASLI
ncbi:MAG TPA: threonine/serine exporter family protein, partial [Chthoniobacterales bacterium]